MIHKSITILFICETILFGCYIFMSPNRVYFDTESVFVRLPGFSGEGDVVRSQLKFVEGAYGPVLCYEVKFHATETNGSFSGKKMWIPRKFVKSRIGWFQRWNYLRR